MRYYRQRSLGCSVQVLHLRKHYPSGEFNLKKGNLIWTGFVTPHGGARQYEIKLHYRPLFRPEVSVVSPNLTELSGGKRVPHLFSQQEQTLCLHYHGVWKHTMLLAETIIPWAVLWTAYFEWWLVTDTWAGDEILHGKTRK